MKTFTDEEIDKIQQIIDTPPEYFDDIEEIVCPYCGESMNLSSDEMLYDESGYPMDCSSCNGDFILYPSMSWSWTTEKDGAE
jgi:hypothetical protein